MSKIIHTVGNMVTIPDESSLSQHETSNCIIFVGKMSYEPNIVAVTFFTKKIFPVLKRKYPELEFLIIGANPDERVKQLMATDGVNVTGYVDSVEPYFKRATIVVAPMLTGAGIQNKIIQAMSYGCCVATTAIGAEGLTISKEEIAIYNKETEWIDGLEYLLNNREIRRNMGQMARWYVRQNLSKEVISKQFWAFVNNKNVNK